MPNLTLLIVFLCTVIWSTIFSCFSSSRIRPYRIVGILASYLTAVIGPFVVGLISGVASWVLMGFSGGLLYYLWQFASYLGRDRYEGEGMPNPITLIHGLTLWPIMLPEVIEYVGAEIGILKPPKSDAPGTS
jgi:hypothetical protein